MLKTNKTVIAITAGIILLSSGLALAGNARHHVRKIDNRIHNQQHNIRAMDHSANKQQRETQRAMRNGNIIGAMKHQQRMDEIRESAQHQRFQVQRMKHKRSRIINNHPHKF
jgi:hypothetical protein